MWKFLKVPIDANRVFGLDIVRALAILFVVLTHSGNFVPKAIMPYYSKLIYDGVGIFFVLSGFLIGGILIKQIETYRFNLKSLLYFWVKRWSRTLPNYYLFLVFLVVSELVTKSNFHFNTYLLYFFFCQNLTDVAPSYFFFHSWSLSVEEWFYLVVPSLLFVIGYFIKTKFRYNFLAIILLIIIGVTILRQTKAIDITTWEDFRTITYGVIYRFDSLMYGMLGAFLAYYFPNFWKKNKKIFLIIASILFVSFYVLKEIKIDMPRYYFRSLLFTLTSLTVLFSLPYLSNLKSTSSKLFKPITYVSLISYSLYLCNSIVVKKIEYTIDWETIMHFSKTHLSLPLSWGFALIVNYILSWILSFLVATLVYKYFEIPSTRFFRNKIHISLDKKVQ